MKHWSLTTLREKLIKIGPKVVHHARYVIFQMAEVAVPRRLFKAILDRIRRLRLPETVPRWPRQRLDTPSSEQEKCLPILGSEVKSPERLAVIVGRRPSWKSQLSWRSWTEAVDKGVRSGVSENGRRRR